MLFRSSCGQENIRKLLKFVKMGLYKVNACLGMILKTEWVYRIFCGKDIGKLMTALRKVFFGSDREIRESSGFIYCCIHKQNTILYWSVVCIWLCALSIHDPMTLKFSGLCTAIWPSCWHLNSCTTYFRSHYTLLIISVCLLTVVTIELFSIVCLMPY